MDTLGTLKIEDFIFQIVPSGWKQRHMPRTASKDSEKKQQGGFEATATHFVSA